MDILLLFLLFFALPIVTITLLVWLVIWRVSSEPREPERTAAVAEVALRLGLCQVADLPRVTARVRELLQPPDDVVGVVNEKPELAFTFNVGKHDAFLYEWSYGLRAGEYSAHVYQRAYVMLGYGAPHLRAVPTALYGKPAKPIEFPEDRTFAKRFWVEGADVGAVRHYLRPGLRRFLLAQGGGWRFHAGPEGVALIARGRTRPAEVAQVRLILERLAAVAEDWARR